MPYVEEDEEEKRRRELAEGGDVLVSGTQTGTIPGSGGTPIPGAKAPNAFVDVAAYLKANKEQSQATAQRVADTMAQERAGLQSGLQGATEGYQESVAAGTVNPDEGLVGRAAANPAEFVKNPNDVSSFAKLRDASYTGPGSFEDTADFGTVLERIKSGQAKAKAIDTSEGRKAYLSSMGQNPTAGVVSLDDLLIGGDPAARAKLTEAAGGFDTLTGALADAKAKAAEALATGKSSTETARTGVANRFTGEGGVIPTFQSLIENKLGTARSQAQKNAAAIQAAVKQGVGLTDQERELIGAGNWDEVLRLRGLIGESPLFQDASRIYGTKVDLAPYLTVQNPDVQFTKENVATPEDYAMEAALQQLSGDNFDILPSDASQAGTAPKTLARIQGNPEEDLRALLNEADISFLNQYKDWGPLTSGNALPWPEQRSDPGTLSTWQQMINIINRNPDKATPQQKALAAELQGYIDGSNVLPPGGGGDKPTDPNNRIRIVDGGFQWWDGNNWVQKPLEQKFEKDSSGNTIEYKFNYDTGQYEQIRVTPPGTPPPGVIRMM